MKTETSPEWGKAAYYVKSNKNPPFSVVASGRNRWALDALIKAGSSGCTPLTCPAPRWSAYVFNLRQMGISILTVTETHAGPFPGSHARYVLQSIVTPLNESEVAA